MLGKKLTTQIYRRRRDVSGSVTTLTSVATRRLDPWGTTIFSLSFSLLIYTLALRTCLLSSVVLAITHFRHCHSLTLRALRLLRPSITGADNSLRQDRQPLAPLSICLSARHFNLFVVAALWKLLRFARLKRTSHYSPIAIDRFRQNRSLAFQKKNWSANLFLSRPKRSKSSHLAQDNLPKSIILIAETFLVLLRPSSR